MFNLPGDRSFIDFAKNLGRPDQTFGYSNCVSHINSPPEIYDSIQYKTIYCILQQDILLGELFLEGELEVGCLNDVL
jgi:hypothetical protein